MEFDQFALKLERFLEHRYAGTSRLSKTAILNKNAKVCGGMKIEKFRTAFRF